MNDSELLVLSGADVRACLPMSDAVEAMKVAFADLANGRAMVPARSALRTPRDDGDVLLMPAFVDNGRTLGVKLLSLIPANTDKGLPLIHALMTLFDGETGRPLAVMNASVLTAIRTGAVCGAATDLMARRDVKQMALFGAGVQAETQLGAVAAVRKLELVRVFDMAPGKADEFAARMSERLGLRIEAVGSAREALYDAEVVSAATPASGPIFDDADIADGVHINAIGAYTPETREVPSATVARSRLVVDQREACMEEAGDVLIPMAEGLFGEDHIAAELGEVVTGMIPGRTDDQQVTLFKSVGLAVQDVVAAARVYEAATRDGQGQRVSL